ncbi:hypothetical protein DFH09DRAFT_1416142 [Mycena vulgaris]|nr:hypothetical protein DFH09DRAFT_1416142 [Mycena vulgaris]
MPRSALGVDGGLRDKQHGQWPPRPFCRKPLVAYRGIASNRARAPKTARVNESATSPWGGSRRMDLDGCISFSAFPTFPFGSHVSPGGLRLLEMRQSRWPGNLKPSMGRTYTVPSPEPLSSSPTGATPLPAQPWPPLPALPEVPPVDSDFSQYLETLHEYGWRRTTFRRDEQKYVALKQEFRFRSPLDLKAFIEKTRNTAASILLRRNLRQYRLRGYCRLRSAGGRDDPEPAWACAAAGPNPVRHSPVPATPTGLPSTVYHRGRREPLYPASRSKRMVPRVRRPDPSVSSPSFPCLYRVYHFHDTTSARDFFNAVVAAIPVPVKKSRAGVEVWLNTPENRECGVFAADGAARARDVDGSFPDQQLVTMEDVWTGRPRRRGGGGNARRRTQRRGTRRDGEHARRLGGLRIREARVGDGFLVGCDDRF